MVAYSSISPIDVITEELVGERFLATTMTKTVAFLSPNTSSTAKARLAFRGCEVGETSSQKRNQGGGSQEQEAKGTVDINRITKKEEKIIMPRNHCLYTL